MQTFSVHPALWQLLRFQTVGKLRKFRANFSTPRRQILSALAAILAVVWLGNAVASMLLRDAYDPAVFARWMSRSLFLYFVWHLVRVAYSRPESAMEWTAAEQTWLCGGPFTRPELLTYRLMVILSTTLPKAGLVAFVLLPDIPLMICGFVGLFLALVFLEYARVILETIASGMSRRQYLALRVMVFGTVIRVVGFGLLQTVSRMTLDGTNHWQFLREWATAMGAVNDSAIGQIFEAPFRVFAGVIMAEHFDASLAGYFGGVMLLVASAAHCAIRLDSRVFASVQDAELREERESSAKETTQERERWPAIPRLRGIGPIAWRQLDYARRHWGTLSVGLGVPAFLACLPLLIPGDGTATFLTVFGGVTFYSFVLLPAALKLDFRRDFDHLPLLKSLPMTPLAVVLGQITTPVFLTLLFQVILLTLAAVVCSVPVDLAVGCILFLVPVTVFFSALDNLIFLLYPHRLHQEGIEVFLRSTLTFTGKGILLTAGLFGVIGWLNAAKTLAATSGLTDHFRIIFVSGIGGLVAFAAMTAVLLATWTYAKLDPTDL